MRVEVQNQITMLGNAVACEVVVKRSTSRRWLCLAPAEGAINLTEVEVPAHVDPEDWPKADSDYVVVSTESFASLAEAITELTDRGVDTNEFDALWKSENPF